MICDPTPLIYFFIFGSGFDNGRVKESEFDIGKMKEDEK